jgi:hypothetical protein
MASRIQKAINAEALAYSKSVTASADAVVAFHDPTCSDDEVARLQRRSGAYRSQWLAAARKLEALDADMLVNR